MEHQTSDYTPYLIFLLFVLTVLSYNRGKLKVFFDRYAYRFRRHMRRVFWKRPPVKDWQIVDPAEKEKFLWPHGERKYLRVYSANDPKRKPTEAWFANDVRRNIADVRSGEYVNLWLLIESLEGLTDRRFDAGFETWLWAIEAVLGEDTCRSIGKTVLRNGRIYLGRSKVYSKQQIQARLSDKSLFHY